jgi:DNA replication protein DnaC
MNADIPEAINPEEIAAKLQRAMVAHEKFQTSPQSSGKAPNSDDMEKVGYPLRAILSLPKMTGRGLKAAEQLLPLAMGDGLVILAGNPGTGKTVIATWLGWKRIEKGKGAGKFLTAYELFGRMKQCWGKNEDSEAVLQAWKKTSFLVIDEAQTRAGTDWENNVLDELINARYAKMLPTVLIANTSPADAQTLLGPRIMDRANECGGIVHCDWASYR